MPYAICPQCGEEIYMPETPDIGDIVRCRTCGVRLEVVGLHPIELDWPWEAEDDLLDDEDDEFSDGFDVWTEDDEELEDDDLDDEDDDLNTDYAAYDEYDEDDFSYARIKHLDD
jgi:lysine biosynthesis protein LysW